MINMIVIGSVVLLWDTTLFSRWKITTLGHRTKCLSVHIDAQWENFTCFISSLEISLSFGLIRMLCTSKKLRKPLSLVPTYLLEVIQDYRIPLHIKPVKVPTISNDLSQKFFWKKVPLFWNKNSKFQKTVIKKAHSMKRFQKFLCVVDGHEAIDFLVFWLFWLRSFFGPFLVILLRSHGSKNDRSQKSYFNEKSVFSCPSTSRRNFWILFMLWLYFYDCCLKLWIFISK